MHQPIPEQGRWLRQVVTGFFNYHAVPTNFPALAASPFLDRERLVCRIRRRHPVSSCFAEHDHLTRPLCSSPITGPSMLLRVDPSQSPASVLSPRGFRRLCFSLAIRGWFLQFRAKAYVRLTPPLRRSPSAQSSGPRWVPEEIHAPGFDDACFLTTRLRRVHCHSSFGHSPAQGPALSFWSNAHHHAFWTQQLGVV